MWEDRTNRGANLPRNDHWDWLLGAFSIITFLIFSISFPTSYFSPPLLIILPLFVCISSIVLPGLIFYCILLLLFLFSLSSHFLLHFFIVFSSLLLLLFSFFAVFFFIFFTTLLFFFFSSSSFLRSHFADSGNSPRNQTNQLIDDERPNNNNISLVDPMRNIILMTWRETRLLLRVRSIIAFFRLIHRVNPPAALWTWCNAGSLQVKIVPGITFLPTRPGWAGYKTIFSHFYWSISLTLKAHCRAWREEKSICANTNFLWTQYLNGP